jgi:ATP-binding cassette, subfamily C, bacterial
VIIGPSGAGKSTLTDIIAGLQLPDQGNVYCDTIRLAQERRIAVAYVTQEVHLFHESIRDILIWVSETPVSDIELWEVLKLAAVEGFVKELPHQLDTIIGERGYTVIGR